MSTTTAKGRLDRGGGEPVSGYISKEDIQTSYDDLEDAWQSDIATAVGATTRVAYYVTGEWQDRPTGLAAYEQVEWRSVLDAAAPPPPAAAGDSWKRAPGAVF